MSAPITTNGSPVQPNPGGKKQPGGKNSPHTLAPFQPGIPSGPLPTAVFPISIDRLKECAESADYWGDILTFHADRLQRKADRWSIMAALLAAVAGLSAWKLVSDNPAWWAVTLTSALALGAAACAVIPRIKNYAETAGKARELAPRYAESRGLLIDALDWLTEKKSTGTAQTQPETNAILAVVREFEAIKRSKDSMRYLPLHSDATRDRTHVKRTPLGGRRQVKREQQSARDLKNQGSN